jgi:hypothetical protein
VSLSSSARGHLGIPEHVGPFREAQVGRDDDAGAFVKLAKQVEQQGATSLAETGDALHAVLRAAGYNLRWLLRAIVRPGLKPVFFLPGDVPACRHRPADPLASVSPSMAVQTVRLRSTRRS